MKINPLTSSSISREGLEPLRHALPKGGWVNYFVDTHIDIVKIDFIFPAGSALQQKRLQATAAIRLVTEGTKQHSAREIAEFMDFRGIVIEKNIDEVSTTLTVYSLRRYLDDLLPLLREIIVEAAYPEEEFRLYVDKRKQHLLGEMMRTSVVARNLFYERLYGSEHPLGQHAIPEDFDKLTVEDVRSFHRDYLKPEDATIVVGGNVDELLLELFDKHFGDFATSASSLSSIEIPSPSVDSANLYTQIRHKLPGAVQNTLRVGRILPMRWNDMDYARFMVLCTILGGYFGSRLMSNIREDKGYTYGIYSQTRICRGSLLFSIMTDVASDVADAALDEIMYELRRLCDVPVGEEELELVKRCMLGDFMRSVDGVFERSERYVQQMTAGIDESFTDNYFRAIDTVTPEELQHIAKQLLRPEELLIVNVGNC